MGRKACCDKRGLKKGPWTADEDKKLRDFIHTSGTKYCWRAVPKRAELLRCGKSCRLRWANYLRPDLKNDNLSNLEEKLVIDLHSQFGNKWSKIASHLPGRTDNYIKNYWHNHIKRNLSQVGTTDSVNHNPLKSDAHNKSRISREEGHYQDKGQGIVLKDSIILKDDVSDENLATDTGFSIDEIPLVKADEIIIPQSHHLPSNSNSCSSSSFPSPSASTPISPTINLIVQNFKSFPYWHSNDIQCKNYNNNNNNNNNNNMGYSSYEDDFIDWDWLINDFDNQD